MIRLVRTSAMRACRVRLRTTKARTETVRAFVQRSVGPVGYFHFVVMMKPMNMMPKPMAMFHAPIDSIGSVEPEM